MRKQQYHHNKSFGRKDPVKKNMDKFHKPSTHRDKTKYARQNDKNDYRVIQRSMTDLNWDGE